MTGMFSVKFVSVLNPSMIACSCMAHYAWMLIASTLLSCPSSVPFDQAHQVDLVGDLLWDSQEQIQVQWSTSELLPTQFHEHRSYEVNITLYEFDLERGEYQERTLLANNVANTGRTTVHVPMLRTNPLSPVVPMALKVSTNIGGAATFGMWSPVAFIYLGDVAKMSTNLRWACSKWYLAELEDVHSKANHSRPCPPVESHMLLPGSGFTEVREAADAATNQHYKSFLTFFYRGARKCYRSVEVSSRYVGAEWCAHVHSSTHTHTHTHTHTRTHTHTHTRTHTHTTHTHARTHQLHEHEQRCFYDIQSNFL